MLKPDIAERIRAIFLHDGTAVTIVDFIILLGWEISTFEAAVKWRVITVEDPAAADPQRYLVLNAQDDEHQLADEIAQRVAELLPPSGPSEHLPDTDQAERVRTHAVAASG